MSRPLAAMLVLAALLSQAAHGDYPAGVRAWGRGDYAAAAAAFLPAAEAGEAESQYMLGRLYALGDGVPRDFVQAWLWFDRAARHGHAEAAQARAVLDHVLNPGQLAQARHLATQPQVLSAQPPSAQPLSPPVVPPAVVPPPGDIPRMVEDRAERPLLLLPRHGAVAVVPSVADQQQAAR